MGLGFRGLGFRFGGFRGFRGFRGLDFRGLRLFRVSGLLRVFGFWGYGELLWARLCCSVRQS